MDFGMLRAAAYVSKGPPDHETRLKKTTMMMRKSNFAQPAVPGPISRRVGASGVRLVRQGDDTNGSIDRTKLARHLITLQ